LLRDVLSLMRYRQELARAANQLRAIWGAVINTLRMLVGQGSCTTERIVGLDAELEVLASCYRCPTGQLGRLDRQPAGLEGYGRRRPPPNPPLGQRHGSDAREPWVRDLLLW
jgi:hypothetical protein